MSPSQRKIAYWPDGSWCEARQVDRYMMEASLSDDFAILQTTWDIPDDKIAELVDWLNLHPPGSVI